MAGLVRTALKEQWDDDKLFEMLDLAADQRT